MNDFEIDSILNEYHQWCDENDIEYDFNTGEWWRNKLKELA